MECVTKREVLERIQFISHIPLLVEVVAQGG